jgi:hypothetical protein
VPLNPGVLGPALIAASGTTDPIGAAGWIAISAVWVPWTIANTIVNPLGGTPMIAAGPVITGGGQLIVGPGVTLGPLLALSAGSLDAAGIEKWTAVANEFSRWLGTCAVNPATLIAYVGPIPPVGPVTGVGTLALVGKPDFATAIGLTDEAGVAYWGAVADAVALQMTLAVMTPVMTNTAPAGPVTGTGTIA